MADVFWLSSVGLAGGAGLLAATGVLFTSLSRGLLAPASGPDLTAADTAVLHESELPTGVDYGEMFADGAVDVLDFDLCPREQRTRPHAMREDGSRRCWECGHETAGNQ